MSGERRRRLVGRTRPLSLIAACSVALRRARSLQFELQRGSHSCDAACIARSDRRCSSACGRIDERAGNTNQSNHFDAAADAGPGARTGAGRRPRPPSSSMTILHGRAACFRQTTGGTRTSPARRSIRSRTRSSTSSAARGRLHPDFGPPPYGIPYVGVGGGEPRVPVTFVDYGDESDRGFGSETRLSRFPRRPRPNPTSSRAARPAAAPTAIATCSIVDRDRWLLFELFATRWTGQRWEAGSGAVFDLSSNARRPEGWTSADAAGLAILPGLVRFDEAMRGPIRHALRATVRRTNGYVWPASHRAGNTAGALPMGARLRLKASKDISRYPGLHPEHLPRHADARADRRRQRQRHVRLRRDGSAMEQRRAQSGVSWIDGRAISRSCSLGFGADGTSCISRIVSMSRAARCAAFDGAVHVALPLAAGVIAGERDPAERPRQLGAPFRFEVGTEHRVTAARVRSISHVMLRKSRTSSGSPSHDSRRTSAAVRLPRADRETPCWRGHRRAASGSPGLGARVFPDRAGIEVGSPRAAAGPSCRHHARRIRHGPSWRARASSAFQCLPQRGGQCRCELEIADDRRRRRQHQVVAFDHRQLPCCRSAT